MINYIKSEIYRNLHNKANYIFLLSCSGFVIFLNAVLYYFGTQEVNFRYNNTYFSFSSLTTNMMVTLILCLPLVSIVFGQEYKHHTLKNTISYGIPREKIYSGKFVVMLIIALIDLVIISAAFIGSGLLLLEDNGTLYLNQLLRALIAFVPLLLFSSTVAQCFYFICENEITAVIWWSVVMIIAPHILGLLGARVEICKILAEHMPYYIASDVTVGSKELIYYWSSQQGLINCFIIGIVGTIIFYLFGMMKFKKVEVK